MYVVHPILGSLNPDISRGSALGEYERYGGVMRRARGTEGAGQFIRGGFLKELGPPVPAGVEKLLGLTQVAAAASVLNLGVSVVGFAIMAKKLDRLQRDMTRLIDMSVRQHDEVMSALADVTERLVELRVIALDNRDLLVEVLDGIARIRKDLVDLQMARVATRLRILQSTDGTLPRTEMLEGRQIFGEARHFAGTGIEPDSRGQLGWHESLLRLRLWCLAAASEVQLLRRGGDLDAAADVARVFATDTRRTVSLWRDVVAPADQFAGMGRFGHTALRDALPAETRTRLHRLAGLDGQPAALRALEHRGALLVANTAVADATFLPGQMARARVLDFLEELAERAESLAEETTMTAQRRLSWDRWERLPVPEGASLAFIEVP